MITVVFDTETTGLPPKKGEPHIDDAPWLIQFAAAVYNGRKLVSCFSAYVEPVFGDKTGTIPNEPFWIENNLTYPEIMPTAVKLPVAIRVFQNFRRYADRVVAHNLEFDRRIINWSHRRVDGVHLDWGIPQICTKLSSMNTCAIPAKYPRPDQPFKWPTLDEAYRHLVNPEGFTGAHDALADVFACAEVLFALEDREIPLVQV